MPAETCGCWLGGVQSRYGEVNACRRPISISLGLRPQSDAQVRHAAPNEIFLPLRRSVGVLINRSLITTACTSWA